MKRTVSGMDAYAKILSTALPEKTDTYTPISHASVINRVRSEITNAGFIITGEDYRCTNDGQIALGALRMNYKADPDIELAANFTNSYNKQLAFRFNLGGLVKVCMNGMMLNNSKFGKFKRVHKGAADLLAEGIISDYINNAGEYWDSLVEHKDSMKEILLSTTAQHDIIGELFFRNEILNTMQLNTVKKEMSKPSFDYKVDIDSAWALYNHITLSLKDSHPSTWMEDQLKVHEVFSNILDLDPEEETIDDVLEEIIDNDESPVLSIDDVLEEIENETIS
jgi:hypothetical protein